MTRLTHSRRQGDIGEAAAIAWLTRAGANILVPLFHSPDYDVVAEFGERLLRVQVKTSSYVYKGRFRVQLSTRGGNRSWSGVVKLFEPCRCDHLFVLVADGRRWFIPASVVGRKGAILLGGPRYAAYQVDDSGQSIALEGISGGRGDAEGSGLGWPWVDSRATSGGCPSG